MFDYNNKDTMFKNPMEVMREFSFYRLREEMLSGYGFDASGSSPADSGLIDYQNLTIAGNEPKSDKNPYQGFDWKTYLGLTEDQIHKSKSNPDDPMWYFKYQELTTEQQEKLKLEQDRRTVKQRKTADRRALQAFTVPAGLALIGGAAALAGGAGAGAAPAATTVPATTTGSVAALTPATTIAPIAAPAAAGGVSIPALGAGVGTGSGVATAGGATISQGGALSGLFSGGSGTTYGGLTAGNWAKLGAKAAGAAYSAYQNSKAQKAQADYLKSESAAQRQYEMERIERLRNGPLAKIAPFLMRDVLGIYGQNVGEGTAGGVGIPELTRIMGLDESLNAMPAFQGWFEGQSAQAKTEQTDEKVKEKKNARS